MSRRNKTKPGILLYFDQVEAFEFFSDAEVGQLVRAALRYGQYRIDTDFSDRALRAAWYSIRLSLTRDNEAYFRDIAEKTYSSRCRAWKEKGVEYPDKDEWVEAETQRLLSDDAERCRSISCAPIREDTITTSPSSLAPAGAGAETPRTACRFAPDTDGENAGGSTVARP